jgi:polysaccharide pyruvyl transferase CsaB
MNPAIEASRKELAARIFDQGSHWRILFLGRSVNGTTDIVSCLSRSLRNLGHHILDIDLKKHRKLTDNPNKVTGGHGPVFLKLSMLEPLLRRFQPQIVICCAGGLTFRPDEADLLKGRGIVLVGITLSDPDVFPTVHEHIHVFDFHTTNAYAALAMYHGKRIQNTLYFPFGIDRGFVTQQVPPAPELESDVICIGHAVGRPERNSLMTQLAAKFHVRTYGRGWEVPDSVVVAGERMVQASRMGKIHINFPLTRAGFINIKCGIFESIGSGALVCSGRFAEMERFFRYDEEIIGYENEADLSAQLRTILGSPEHYRRLTEKAFYRLISEHLYEHRWMSLFETIFNASPVSTPWLPDTRIAAIRRTLSHSYPRAKKVILSGFYGANNLGDELILTSIRQGLENADAGTQVWVAAENPQNIERDHGLQSFSRKNHFEALQSVRTASAVVLGGGGLWHDYTFERSGGLMGLFSGAQISIAGFGILPILGRMFELPFHVVGMGVGPLEQPDARRMMKFVAEHAETIYVRDSESAQILQLSGLAKDKVHVAPDVVYALKLPEAAIIPEIVQIKANGKCLIGLNLRPWARMEEDAVVSAVAQAIQQVNATREIAVIGIPMQAGDKVDIAVLRRVAKQLGTEVTMINLEPPLTLETLAGALSQVDVLLSMRLHACLMAHRMRKPVVGIAYDPKVASHFAELGRSSFCLAVETTAAPYYEALVRALTECGTLPDTACRAVTACERLANDAVAIAAKRIAELPPPQVVYEVPVDAGTSPENTAPAALPVTVKTAATPAPPVTASVAAITPAKPLTEPPPNSDAEENAEIAGRVPGTVQFSKARIETTQITIPENRLARYQTRPDELAISLPTDKPLQGQVVTINSMIELPKHAVEVALALHSDYENPKTMGRIDYEVRIGDRILSEDIARSSQPVQIRALCAASTRLPVTLSLRVKTSAKNPSSAWPRASEVRLRLLSVSEVNHGHELMVFSDKGLLAQA